MARVPGTETASNKAGWQPGDGVRCRRSRANGELGLADTQGFLVEVRPGHVRVVVDLSGRSVWLESVAVLAQGELSDAGLERLASVFRALRGRRLEVEEGGHWAIFSESFPSDAVDEVRNTLGDQLVAYELACHGVHELVSRLQLRAPDSRPG
ncbi:MAG: hypothetical protein DHS20C15_14270 [Planctomycetota bacterium]|nr:MAG: hypothetical protein DHS20C15_14270 [Planctomycetota bacterium]